MPAMLLADFSIDSGDTALRHDLQILDAAGLVEFPIASWPISRDDVLDTIADIEVINLGAAEHAALSRIRMSVLDSSINRLHYTANVASHPRKIRTFSDTPRNDGQAGVEFNWSNASLAIQLNAAYVIHPADGDQVRPDGSRISLMAGNWIAAAGWQDRWWGPGHQGSLILSNNARPLPAISLKRNRSYSFSSRWLRWIGPWTAQVFMAALDDERAIEDPLMLGFRFAFRPIHQLEIGLSRTAQWCGRGRPCGGSEFFDLLLGRDNRGVNISAGDEPGNQLAGIDLRWRLPRNLPVSLYLQWVAEDTRRGGPELGNWLRLAGLEVNGLLHDGTYSAYAEVADTSCRSGGAGFSQAAPDCAYEHSIYTTGYRYKGLSLGHGLDGDGLSYSVGTTLVQSGGHRWTAAIRYADINRVGAASLTHSLSSLPLEQLDVTLDHGREVSIGTLNFGLGWRYNNSATGQERSNEAQAYLAWRSH